MKVTSRSLLPLACLASWLTLGDGAAYSAPQAGIPPVSIPNDLTPVGGYDSLPQPSALPPLELSPIDAGSSPVDDISPAQLSTSPANPAPVPPPAQAPRAPGASAPRRDRATVTPPPPSTGFGVSDLFAPDGPTTASPANRPMALNSIGDQGVIGIVPPGNKGPAISITRNFALNVTDNNSAPLQNRLIPLEYYHFFDSNRVYPGLVFNPRRFAAAIVPSQSSRTRVQTQDDRYVFGFEAIVAPRMSILFRQSVVTIQQPDIVLQQGTKIHTLGGIRSGWSDLQISPKFLLYEDKKYTATTGLGMIVPLGANAPYHQFGNSAFVLEPFLLLLAKPTDRLVLQAGFEYDIPLANNLSHVSLFRYLLFAGYKIYDDPEGKNIKQVYPLIEFHGSDLVGGFTQDTVNFTIGVRVNAFRKSQFGLGYSVPVTQDRQFSNEVLFNYNIFF